MLKHLDQRRRDEEGFTLIELMVVVLILGILMAIAIPTFLSTTKSAKGVAGESNATNAATSEVSTYATSQLFDSSAYAAGAALLDPALPWDATTTDATAATGKILVLVSSTVPWASGMWSNAAAATGTIMLLESLSSNGNCYIVLDDQSTTTPNVGYLVDTSGCPATAPTTAPTAGTPTAGSAAAANHTVTALPAAWTGYYSNF